MLKSIRNCVQVFLLDWRTDKANDNFKKINRMKKFITLMILSALCLGAKAQYQLANSDFEEWEAVSQKVGWSTKKGKNIRFRFIFWTHCKEKRSRPIKIHPCI